MRWSFKPFGGVLELDAGQSPLGVPVDLEIITSDGHTFGMWVLRDTGTLFTVVIAGEA